MFGKTNTDIGWTPTTEWASSLRRPRIWRIEGQDLPFEKGIWGHVSCLRTQFIVYAIASRHLERITHRTCRRIIASPSPCPLVCQSLISGLRSLW